MLSESILKRAQERETRSQEHKARFLAGDETALRDFCRTDPFAMQTKWVQDAIQKALFCDNRDILDKLFKAVGKGKGKEGTVTKAIEDLIIKDAVDRAAMETGLPKTQPITYNPDDEIPPPETVFDWLCRRENSPYFPSLRPDAARTLHTRYGKLKNKGPEFMVENVPGGTILRRGPDIIPLPLFGLGEETVIGIMEVFIPSDGSEQTINVNAVFNIPYKSTIREDIAKQMMAATAPTT